MTPYSKSSLIGFIIQFMVVCVEKSSCRVFGKLILLCDVCRTLTEKRQYGEIVMPLQGIMNVMEHFNNYMDIPQIRDLADKVNLLSPALQENFSLK